MHMINDLNFNGKIEDSISLRKQQEFMLACDEAFLSHCKYQTLKNQVDEMPRHERWMYGGEKLGLREYIKSILVKNPKVVEKLPQLREYLE